MPITENNFTGEELTASIDANPALLDILKGAVLNTEKIRGVIEPEIINPKKKEWADRDEAETLALTGVKKGDKEPFYDYRKRAFAEKLKAQEDELALLKDKTNPSAADKARIETLEKTLQEKDTEFNGKLSAKDKEVAQIRVEANIDAAIFALKSKYKKDIDASLIEMAEQNAKAQIMAIAQVQEDKTVTFHDAEGKILLSKTDYKPLKASDLLEEKLKAILDAGQKAAGAGSDDKKKSAEETGKFTGVPSDVTTQVQLSEYLLKLGFTPGSAEYDKIWKDEANKLKLR